MAELPERLRRRGAPVLLLAVLLALAVAVLLGLLRSPPQRTELAGAPSAGASAAEPAAELPRLLVHVTGAVASPGLVSLAADARVLDAIAAAGGLTAEAEPSAINLARPLADGEQLHVPRIGEAPPLAAGSAPSAGPINLNHADLATLETLPRVGPTLAQRIIDWRSEHGPFRSVEDLREVTGIGERIFAEIAPLVRAP